MNYQEILYQISQEYERILNDNLVGIYVHGSIAFGCFNSRTSDIDFIVVVRNEPTLDEKEKLIKILLELSGHAPEKGLEMSVVKLDICRNFVYPTPFELHFSNAHIKKCQENLEVYCKTMKGVDRDLAAHFMVIKKTGIVLCGEEISSVFGDVPKEYYLDSIKSDIENVKDEIYENPTYFILNLCRVFAYISEELILSKEQGGLWGIEHLPFRFTALIQSALTAYRTGGNFENTQLLYEFCDYMRKCIFDNDNY